MMNEISLRLSGILEKNKIIKPEYKNVYAYGIRAMIMRIICTLSMFGVSIMFDKVNMILFFYAGFMFFRSLYPGYHAPNRIICFICSTSLIFICIFLSDFMLPLLVNDHFLVVTVSLYIGFVAFCHLKKLMCSNHVIHDKSKKYGLSIIIVIMFYILAKLGFTEQAFGLYISVISTYFLYGLKKLGTLANI